MPGMRLVGLAPADDDDAVTRAVLTAELNARAARTARVTVDFGEIEDTTATGVGFAAWVDADAVVVCVPDPAGGPDHSAEDAAVEQVTAVVTYVAPGIGFDVVATSPGGTWGRYTFLCKG